MAAAGAEIGDLQRTLGGERAQTLDLAPQLGLGAGVEHVEVEAAHAAHGGARAQLVDDRQRRDLPHRRVGPRSGEAQFVLSVLAGQLVFGQAEVGQPFHEVRLEDLPIAVKCVAGEPDQLVLGEAQRARVVELVDQLALVDDVGEADLAGAIVELEGDLAVAMQLPDHLLHQ